MLHLIGLTQYTALLSCSLLSSALQILGHISLKPATVAQECHRSLHTEQEEKSLFAAMQQSLKTRQQALDERAAAIPCLQLMLIVLACRDPGPETEARLLLPALQERLHDKARKFMAHKADTAVAASASDDVSPSALSHSWRSALALSELFV